MLRKNKISKNDNSFLGYILNVFLIGELLFEKIEDAQFKNYLTKKRKELYRNISYSKFEVNKNIVSSFLANNYLKKNFGELSDFVKEYYDNKNYFDTM